MFGRGCVHGYPAGSESPPLGTPRITDTVYSKGLTIKTTSSLRQRPEFRAQRLLSVNLFLQPPYSDKFYRTEIIRKRSRVIPQAFTLICVHTERQR